MGLEESTQIGLNLETQMKVVAENDQLREQLAEAEAKVEKMRKVLEDELKPVPDGESWAKCYIRRVRQIEEALK